MKTKSAPLAGLVLAIALAHATMAETVISVQADQSGPKINPAMWGIFFEDINFGADGGLYAELVKNRSFEFPDGLMGWSKVSSGTARGAAEVRDEQPFDPANPHYLRLASDGAAAYGVANEGFRGIGVRAGEAYDFSAQIRLVSNAPALGIELMDADGKVLASTRLENLSGDWNKKNATLRPNATAAKAHLNVILEGEGVVDLDMVSLFPEKTWKNRPGGLRADMVQMLADLKPGFLRFPGGCIVEGSVLDRRYQWKTTIGPIEDRKLIVNRWNYEFKHRLTPDYYQSFGLGFFEYFQLCEDIGAEPLPILNCGMACQFNSGQLVPLTELDPYIQDALDLIEFANGPVSSPWGARRAAMGHPEPFNMKLLGIGNEQWGQQYFDRYPIFAKAIKAKYPDIEIISSAGPSPGDDRFNFAWPKLRALNADIVDEHCYANPLWFLAGSHRFDSYDRNGPKVFFGEYAAQSVAIVSPDNKNNLDCALSEAAFMTGMERNADVVRMASYAPLFAHIDAWQWTPNLIWTDNLRVYGTPNYYVQQMFSLNRGDVVVPTQLTGAELPSAPSGGVGLGTSRASAEFKGINVTRDGQNLLNAAPETDMGGWSPAGGNWSTKDEVYRQTDAAGSGLLFAGSSAWENYTVSFKARKLEGADGIQVIVRRMGAENYVVWNLGASGMTLQARLGLQDQLLAHTGDTLETGKWYDLKVQLTGDKLECYVDGKLWQSVVIPAVTTQSLYANAVRDQQSGEIILKVVNPGDSVQTASVNLSGIASLKPVARLELLTADDRNAVNSLNEPRHVAPIASQFAVTGPKFDHAFPARSFSVIRLSPN